jgi:hypothetical protein
LEKSIRQKGDHFESRESDTANSIYFSSWEVGSSGHLMDTLYVDGIIRKAGAVMRQNKKCINDNEQGDVRQS